ncbi:MAG: hypothetical protein HC813_02060 [Planctomycetes bacterium]|nr:hypothetical protein [Planctomycetota bacterium]
MDSLTWTRLTDPPAWPAGGDGNALRIVTHLDGTPVARHSVDSIAYIPDPVDRLFVAGGYVDSPGGLLQDHQTYTFDLDTLRWTPGVEVTAIGIGAHGAVAPDGRYWAHGSGPAPFNILSVVDVAAQTSSDHVAAVGFYLYEATSAIDEARNLLVAVGNNETRTWNLASPDDASVVVPTSGDTAMEGARNPGLIYRADLDRFVAWSGGKDVFTLDPATSVWTRIVGTGTADPGAPQARGTYGRFAYVQSLDAFVVVSSADSNVFVYRLP